MQFFSGYVESLWALLQFSELDYIMAMISASV